ncbi:hypothetical protein E0H33_09320, partial [Rhizobium leguminosarum bv. viciae]
VTADTTEAAQSIDQTETSATSTETTTNAENSGEPHGDPSDMHRSAVTSRSLKQPVHKDLIDYLLSIRTCW